MLKKTTMARTLQLAFAATVLSTALSQPAFAQAQTGTVSGTAAPGSVISIVNKEIGYSRTVTVGADGRYQISQLPGGQYTLAVSGAGEAQVVTIVPGQGATASFSAGVQQVVVAGRASRIDVKSPESATVLNKAAIDRLPVLRDVTAVALLAPGATAGDNRIGATGSRGGNVPSLGGASPAENVYYINGFNVTNSLNGVAFNQVPFDAIAQQEVKTGGYGAEYGRSLGGVLSVTTKRGTNTWTGGANVIYTPESLSAKQVYADKSATTGKWVLAEKPGGTDDLKTNLWAGGPIIQDKLFIFGLVQGAKTEQKSYFNNTQQVLKNNDPQYLVKVDWNINQSNLLEFTGFSDKNKDKIMSWKSPVPYGTQRGESQGTDVFTNGGTNLVGKWTSYLTDDFTVSALYGVGKYNRNSSIASASCPSVQDERGEEPIQKGCWTVNSITSPGAKDQRKALRLDAEWNLGAHGLRFGLDRETYDVVDGRSNTGVGNDLALYRVYTLAPGSELSNGFTNTTGAPLDYIDARTFQNGGVFTTKNSAFYIEDNWQATKNVVLNLGLRSESFNNLNAEGIDFIKVSNTIAPRLGLVWDVQGNARSKIFANAGRYYIPVMSNTNVRLSGAELDYTDFYAFNGFTNDRYETPIKGAQLGDRVLVSNGKAANPKTVVDPNIKPMYQDEYIIGGQQALNNRWTVSAKFTHRNLKSVMDDVCNDEGARDWALANNYSAEDAETIAGTVGHCFLYNPGRDLTANVDFKGDGKLTTVTIPAASLKFPKPKRTYNALELGFDRAWDGKWSLQGSYVLAYSKGNTEGYVKSDIGQDDAGISQDWDYPGLAEGADGYLPNDRRHTLKAFGAYQITPELRMGANIVIQSGRPRNCLGFYAGELDHVSVYYGPASFYCNRVLQTRGTLGRTEWKRELGLQLSYAPAWKKGLSFTVDALNVLNERAVLSVDEAGESALGTPYSQYERPIGIQRGRSVRLTAQYEF